MVSSAQIINWLLLYRYFVLFPLIVVEGPITMILGGFLSATGHFNVIIVYVLSVFGDLLGDLGYFFLGYFGRKKLIKKWRYLLRINESTLKKIDTHFEKHKGKTLMFGKLSHGMGMPVLISAGISRMPIKDFLWFNFLATLPKALILVLIGFYYGSAFVTINKYLKYWGWGFVFLFVLGISIFYLLRKVTNTLKSEV
ncbi:hypothetical protein COV24_02315 [candidate division WWE3 bacterium CG10_big_fil_rev_8_21_14_0_10_32_10]|uniref:VTT domain-containing protein n=1 Tax=candidate division WWE3 bacterium CG10_big_fil_rev_8_21_14_0_10_32_10 TaxID=1975090 RepID=A0A2H0RAG4_UNCKA|nr:MAG: hypothetical protein COV24_02315 [candidate division WWE3 bacterium CG10_big_fil_rev_8_21_14_0_10_32_10]